jgi:hypothetical protein
MKFPSDGSVSTSRRLGIRSVADSQNPRGMGVGLGCLGFLALGADPHAPGPGALVSQGARGISASSSFLFKTETTETSETKADGTGASGVSLRTRSSRSRRGVTYPRRDLRRCAGYVSDTGALPGHRGAPSRLCVDGQKGARESLGLTHSPQNPRVTGLSYALRTWIGRTWTPFNDPMALVVGPQACVKPLESRCFLAGTGRGPEGHSKAEGRSRAHNPAGDEKNSIAISVGYPGTRSLTHLPMELCRGRLPLFAHVRAPFGPGPRPKAARHRLHGGHTKPKTQDRAR